jgi:hypothetical protein
MRSLHTLARQLALISILALAGCQMALPFGGGDTPPAAALPGGEIEVTALDPVAGTAALPDVSSPGADAALPDLQSEDSLAAEDPPAAPLAKDEAPADTAAEAAEEEPVAAPVEVKSDAQLRCERQGGDWASGSESALKTCVKPTGDGGKQCSRQTDCKGECLARSGTCAPISPLLGCNDILLADGTRTTQCIE